MTYIRGLTVIKNDLGVSDDTSIIVDKRTDISGIQWHIHISRANDFNTFDLNLLDINRYIPLFYWNLKQYKGLYTFRLWYFDKPKFVWAFINSFLFIVKWYRKRRTLLCNGSWITFLSFINKISDIKTAWSTNKAELPTLYTNLPLDVIYYSLSLRFLIIKVFGYSKYA